MVYATSDGVHQMWSTPLAVMHAKNGPNHKVPELEHQSRIWAEDLEVDAWKALICECWKGWRGAKSGAVAFKMKQEV